MLPPDRYASFQSSRSRRSLVRASQPARRFKVKYLVLIALLLVGYGFWNQHASAHALAISRLKAAQLQQRQQRIAAATAQVNQLLAGQSVTWSISVAGVSNGATKDIRQFGTTGDFDAASVSKVLTAADYLHQVETGHASLTQSLSGQRADRLLATMVINSDDAAWETLNTYLTHATLTRYARELGLTDYDAQTNHLSTGDAANLLARLWQGKLLNSDHTKLLLGYLERANYREYIVPAVPADATVYHKVGIDGDEVNDAAVIHQGDQTMVLVIFTNGNGTYGWPARAALMQQITKLLTAAYLTT